MLEMPAPDSPIYSYIVDQFEEFVTCDEELLVITAVLLGAVFSKTTPDMRMSQEKDVGKWMTMRRAAIAYLLYKGIDPRALTRAEPENHPCHD